MHVFLGKYFLVALVSSSHELKIHLWIINGYCELPLALVGGRKIREKIDYWATSEEMGLIGLL